MLPERTWQLPLDTPIPPDLLAAFAGPEFLVRALIQRGITTPRQLQEFLNPNLYQPASPDQLPDLEKAADALYKAIRSGKTIGVWGDFDVDGQSSTTLLVSAIRQLGGKVRFYIPVRERESHGIQLQALKRFLLTGVDLLLTCDTGVSAHESVAFAQQNGVPVIITDHHALPGTLPSALAVVNPQRLPSNHPLQPLCGVGTAFKLAEALYDLANQKQASEALIDLAALGTIADVASLRGDNRWIVQMGLQRIRQSPRPAIQQLCTDMNINYKNFTEEHVGFFVAPLLNAIGRLGDANPIVDFLQSDDRQLISVRSAELRGLNEKRKLQCDQVFAAAMDQIQRDPSLLDLPILILHHPSWPGGVVGIVASRLVERFNRPVILFTGDQLLRGSGRSIEGINLIQIITTQASLLKTFGGHPMAAGLSLIKDNLNAFRIGIAAQIREMVSLPLPPPSLQIDSFLSIPDINLDLAEQIDRLAPFGAGNPALQFAFSNVKLISHRRLGNNRDHLEALVEDDQQNTLRLLWWQGGSQALPTGRFDLAFTLHASDYRGVREVQAEWTHARPIVDQAIEIQPSESRIIWHDHRSASDALEILEQLIMTDPQIQVWKDGLFVPPPQGVFLHQLQPGNKLVIWNIPSSWQALSQALQRVTPSQVYLFGNPSAPDTLDEYMKLLLRLIRYRVNHQNGQVTLEELSSASGMPGNMVSLALDYLSARGILTIISKTQENYILSLEADFARIELYELQQRLHELYNEIKAYQTSFTHLPLELIQTMQ